MLEECKGRWRVVVDNDVERFFEVRGFLADWKRHVAELERDLNVDPGKPLKLLDSTEHPVLGRVELPGGWSAEGSKVPCLSAWPSVSPRICHV